MQFRTIFYTLVFTVMSVSITFGATYNPDNNRYVCNPDYLRSDSSPKYHTNKGCTDTPFKALNKCGRTWYMCYGDDGCPSGLSKTEISGGHPLKDSGSITNSLKDIIGGVLPDKEYATDCGVGYPIIYPRKFHKSYLSKGEAIKLGQYICSDNKKLKLKFQADGNLCLYQAKDNSNGEKYIWCNMKYNYGQNANTMLIMQRDGNLVIYRDGLNGYVWDSKTYGNGITAAVLDYGYFAVTGIRANAWDTKPNVADNSLNFTFSDCK